MVIQKLFLKLKQTWCFLFFHANIFLFVRLNYNYCDWTITTANYHRTLQGQSVSLSDFLVCLFPGSLSRRLALPGRISSIHFLPLKKSSKKIFLCEGKTEDEKISNFLFLRRASESQEQRKKSVKRREFQRSTFGDRKRQERWMDGQRGYIWLTGQIDRKKDGQTGHCRWPGWWIDRQRERENL